MNDVIQYAAGDDNLEPRLWEYIDGLGSAEERAAIEIAIHSRPAWKTKYDELMEIHQLVQTSALDEPSLRFTKNVMEEIAKYKIAPATKSYIDQKVVWGLGIFFVAMIVGFLIYGFGQADWTSTQQIEGVIPAEVTKFDFTKFFNNAWVNVFLMINVVLGLMLLDRYLDARKKKFQKEA
ncbi:MAG TPA: hypothetical protein VGC95_12005 [Chitinophagaceae bacterium]